MRISTVRHPNYALNDYELFRYTYRGGRDFVNRYLVKFSKREDEATFQERKAISYCPAFAKVAINKLKNAFTGRMPEIIRKGGPESYTEACLGKGGGVDLFGSNINSFISRKVLTELMVMGKVGIYVDRPALRGNTKAANRGNKPYIYTYAAEDIYSWALDYHEGEYVYTHVLLHDKVVDYKNGLPCGVVDRYREIWLDEERRVRIQVWKSLADEEIDPEDEDQEDIKVGPEIVLNLNRIPFVMPSLESSLLTDTAQYQVGLLNICSGDLQFVHGANSSFYVEQFDPAAEATFQRVASGPFGKGTAAEGAESKPPGNEIGVGPHKGRRVPKGTEMPQFIAPPAEPLLASMRKQDQMKGEIFELIDIAASNAIGAHASAESKQMDNQGLEGGMYHIGLELQWAEQELAKIWATYTGEEPAIVLYPTKFSNKTDEQRQKEAENLDNLKCSVPSRTFRKEAQKQMAHTLFSGKIDPVKLVMMEEEIDNANYSSSDADEIQKDIAGGLVSAETASNARGYNGAAEVPVAQKEHAERLALIAQSQATGAARGVQDQSGLQGDPAKDEKTASQKTPDTAGDPTKTKTRGTST